MAHRNAPRNLYHAYDAYDDERDAKPKPKPKPKPTYEPIFHVVHEPISNHAYDDERERGEREQRILDDDITKKALLPISEKITSSLFIDDVPDFLMCEICMDVLNEPLLTTCCGQSYCRECVNQLRQNTCPHCRDPLNTIEDKKSSRILSNTKIKCPYHLFNKCKWNGNTSDLKSHLTTCQFKPVTCAKKCGVSRERKNIDRHLKTECDLRSQYCQYCSKEVVHKEMSGHVAECPIFPLDCPNGCSQSKILRQDMKKHIEKCPLEIVSCEFAKFGCNVKPKRQELSNHNTSNMGDHVVLLARAIAIKDEKINQLENKVITLETKLKNKRII